ncbi:NADP-dependent oxidoreductase [uncultured Pseudoteredinibacter sp.]|uniref:NADP-dependent oxidoreductase n=1 Tax=uncultured Pseudoteredinibacter sp. TaxID=1641701 RepID=UPI0026041CE4|nr:NADP-dependent oxidoreductase [uncultured Pseudoteredinibacter sp.]
MTTPMNTAITLKQRPNGEVRDEDFEITQSPVRELQDGEFLIENKYLSLDPYMRPRLNDMQGYMDPVEIGAVIVGEAVGEVIASKTDAYQVGDIVTAYTGWQTHYIAKGDEPMIYKVDAKGLPLSVFLGAAGMPGRTGYFGLTEVGKPQTGETIVVSAASGAVGSLVGQVAKSMGLRVVGVAGGDQKCGYVTEELGFDACVDYKAGNLDADLAAACPNGIDIYFENVGGAVTRAVSKLLNKGSRVPVCGYVSAYNAEDMAAVETPFHVFGAMEEPPEHRFFLVTEWQEQHGEATALLANKIKDGQVKYRESVAEGIDNAVEAFRGMLKGKNFGKQVVKLG